MAKGKGTGKPCGATHIASDRVCRVNMPSAVGAALNAASGEVGAKTLKAAVQKYAGGKGVARLREIRADIKKEMGGNIVKGPRADELKKRLQAEGLLPNGKAKSVAPDSPTDLRKQLAVVAAQKLSKGRTEKEMEDLSRIMRGEEPKYMNIVSDVGELGMGARMKSQSQIAQLQSVLGLGSQTRQEVGRDLEGLVEEARALKRQKQVEMANANPKEWSRYNAEIDQINKAIVGPQTAASSSTKYAREDARTFDGKMAKEQLRREGDKTFDKWDETTGKGAKKLGSGAFGTVIITPDKSYAVKRGDISDTEARLIQRLGDRDLGPKLIAADVNGPGNALNPGVDIRRGRLAMSVVPGRPIGKAAPDKIVGGVKVADAYWKARADLHRMGIAHNDMHIDNVLVDKKGKGRFVDMGLAQGMPKAALAEALGVFDKPQGSTATRPAGVQGQGDWQARRWDGTAGVLLGRASRGGTFRKELEQKAPFAAKAFDNKTNVMVAMRKDGLNNDDIATVMDHGLRNKPSTYTQGVWQKISDEQAMKYIDLLYEGI